MTLQTIDRFKLTLLICVAFVGSAGCGDERSAEPSDSGGLGRVDTTERHDAVPEVAVVDDQPDTPVDRLIAGALEQVGKTTTYDPAYVKLEYPGGDVPIERGVCTDVLVRAFRKAGVDLQVLIHEDMTAAFKSYPNLWGLSRPDRNIDHRRVPNITTFLHRTGKAVPVTKHGGDYLPGDIVVWRLPNGRLHTGIVSNVMVSGTQRHKVVHNIGAGAQLEDMLFRFEITDHFRYYQP